MTLDEPMNAPNPFILPHQPSTLAMSDAPSTLVHGQFMRSARRSTTSTSTTNTSGSAHSGHDMSFQSTMLPSNGSRPPRTLAPNLTRRSHKKSRAGCYTCKSRKIKCGEQKPRCGNCQMKGLNCVYPVLEAQKKRETPVPLVKRAPSTSSPGTSTFTALDMRFFHHFLTTAYPHLPLGNDHIWVNEVPLFAEGQEYLMHAILSLGASHLGRLTGVDYRKESLIHRGLALAGLNHALSQPAKEFGQADAMLAACYALTFQASYMGDGLLDFITMLRGCALTINKIKQESAITAFNLEDGWHYKVMAPRLQYLPQVNPILLEEGIEALERVRPFLSTDLHGSFHHALHNVLSSLLSSSQSGYEEFSGVYNVWCELCHDSFKSFLDPNNIVAQLLLAYFVPIQMIMVPLAVYEWPKRANSYQAKVLYGMVEWAEGLFDRIKDTPLSEHLTWPKRIVQIVVAELNGDYSDGPSVLQLDLPISQDTSPEELPFELPFEPDFWTENLDEIKMIPELLPDHASLGMF